MREFVALALVLLITSGSSAEEISVTIKQVSGQKILVSKASQATGGFQGRRGRGMQRGGAETATVVVGKNVKITTAQRARRTGEIMVGVELAGGLKNDLFKKVGEGLPARIITDGDRIIEINVFTEVSDINQSNSSDGEIVIAVRPKRPPTKRVSNSNDRK